MSESASRDSNVKHRRESFIKALRQYESLDDEKKAISEAMSAIVKGLKDDFQINPKSFKNAYKVLKMTVDESDTMFDEMREIMEAAGRGHQLDWVEISNRREKAKADAFAGKVTEADADAVAEQFRA